MRRARRAPAVAMAAVVAVAGLSAATAPTPTAAPVKTPVRSIAIGRDHVLIVRADRTLVSIGSNRDGQLGVDVPTGTDFPYHVPTEVMRDVVEVAAGDAHSLVLQRNGVLWAFGSNGYGQLGTPAEAGAPTPNPTPRRVMTGVTHVAASQRVSLVVKADGTLWGFGQSHEGQLGGGVSYGAITSTPTPIMSGVADVAVGYNHVLALRADGTVWSWGANYNGQLGTTRNTQTGVVDTTPTQVLTRAIQVAAGFNHSLVVKADGSLWTFGANSDGQLGGGLDAPRGIVQASPTKVMDGVAQAAAGDSFSIVRTTDGKVWTFGRESQGQLGRSAGPADPVPGFVMDGATDIAATWTGALVKRSDDSVWRFGWMAQSGYGTPAQLYPFVSSTPSGTVPPVSTPSAATSAFASLCTGRTGALDWFRVIVRRTLRVPCSYDAPVTPAPSASAPPPGGTVVDCGGYNNASGWPSTPAPMPGMTDCIVRAFEAGTRARFVMWSNTSSIVPRMLRTTYEVLAPHLVRVTTDPTRAASGNEITVSECEQFFADWLTVRVAKCRVVATNPVTAPTPKVDAVLTSAPSVLAGQPVTVAVTVTTSDMRPVTTGYVLVAANDRLLTEAEPRAEGPGRTTFTLRLRAGNYALRAYFSGVDDEYRPAESAPLSVEVRTT